MRSDLLLQTCSQTLFRQFITEHAAHVCSGPLERAAQFDEIGQIGLKSALIRTLVEVLKEAYSSIRGQGSLRLRVFKLNCLEYHVKYKVHATPVQN